MAVNPAPIGVKPQFELADGTPAVGNKLFMYVAGSVNTKQDTYTDWTGGVANTNPLVLNSLGMPTTEIWFTAGLGYKVVYAPSTDTDPPTSPIWTVDHLMGINDVTVAQDQWVAFNGTPTFVGATSFTLAGDQTSIFHKARRLKSTNSGGTIYSTVISSVFGALTTVTVANDSGSLDAGLSAVSYSLIAADNPSIDADMVNRKGASVVSAATTNIWGTVGDFLHVTGATGPITSLGTAPYTGAMRTVIFDSTPTLTHNATSLILPGGANIVVGAGDRMIVRADTTANMVVVHYERQTSIPGRFPRGHLWGCGITNNAGDATNDIDFAVGEARDSTNAVDMVALTAMTKQLDVAWSAGTAAGGRLSAAAITNTTYHCYVIRKDSDGTCDFGFDTSPSAPTMPVGYTFFRRIASIVRLGGTILAFTQWGNRFEWTTLADDNTNWAALSTTAGNYVCTVPTGLRVLVMIQAWVNRASTSEGIFIYQTTQTDQVPDPAANGIGQIGITAGAATSVRVAGALEVLTNTSAQLRARSAIGLTSFDIRTRGWIDLRGKED